MEAKGIVWLAVSSKKQTDNVSLGEQLRQGLFHAAQRRVGVVGVLIVPGKSRSITLFGDAADKVAGFYLSPSAIEAGLTVGVEAYIKQSPLPPGVEPVRVYAKFLELARTKQFNVLFFLNRSRLGRKASLSMSVVGVCDDYSIIPFDMESPPATLEKSKNRDDRFVGAFKSVEGENQIIKIQDDHRTGMIRRVEKGRMPGKVNWGYLPTYQAGKLSGYTIDEDAATTIRLIVTLYLDNGFGALNIADHLNRQGLPAPAGGQWGHSQITFLLRRIWRYAGFAELNVHSKTNRPYVRAVGNWPAIINEETARRVIAEREARNSTRRSVHTVYRFTRMVYCGVCGSRLHASTKYRAWTRADGTPGRYQGVYYRCPAEHVFIVESKIMAFMMAFMEDFTSMPDARAKWLNQPTIDQSAEIVASIQRINAHIDKLNAGTAKAGIDYYSRGALDEDTPIHQAIVSALKKQVIAAQAEITTLQDKLHEEERNSQRQERIDDIAANTLTYLAMEDVRTGNAWLRIRFAITVESKRVTDVDILF